VVREFCVAFSTQRWLEQLVWSNDQDCPFINQKDTRAGSYQGLAFQYSDDPFASNCQAGYGYNQEVSNLIAKDGFSFTITFGVNTNLDITVTLAEYQSVDCSTTITQTNTYVVGECDNNVGSDASRWYGTHSQLPGGYSVVGSAPPNTYNLNYYFADDGGGNTCTRFAFSVKSLVNDPDNCYKIASNIYVSGYCNNPYAAGEFDFGKVCSEATCTFCNPMFGGANIQAADTCVSDPTGYGQRTLEEPVTGFIINCDAASLTFNLLLVVVALFTLY